MPAKINIEVAMADQDGASVISRQPRANAWREALNWLIAFFGSLIGGLHRARFRIGVDESVGAKATITITCVQASATAGDRLRFDIPGLPPVYLTAVAGTPNSALGQYAIITSDTAEATSIAAAINLNQALMGLVTATPSAGTVILTAFKTGIHGNVYVVTKMVTTPGAFTGTGTFAGGAQHGALSAAITMILGGALTNNDTVTIGGVVLTGKSAAPSGESQFLCAVSAAADGAALAACINAHSKLKGIVLASGTTTVSVAPLYAGRLMNLLTFAKSAAQITLSAATYTPLSTDTWVQSPIDYTAGST